MTNIIRLLLLFSFLLAGTVCLAQDSFRVSSNLELVVQTGHSDAVKAVAFSADGKMVASGSLDHTVKMWEVETGRELRTIKDHADAIYAIALSPAGLLASGGKHGTIRVWYAANSRVIGAHSDSVNAVAFAADSRILASGSKDHTIKVWDLTGRELRTLRGHSDSVNAVALSLHGNTLVSGSSDQTIRLWDVTTGRELRTLRGHSASVNALALSTDGNTLVTGGADGTIKLWDVASGRELRTLSGNSGAIQSVSFSVDGRTLATGGADKTIRVWDLSTGQELRTFAGHSDSVYGVALSPDGKRLASGSADKTTKLWEIASGRELLTFTGYSSPVTSVAFSPNGETLACGGEDATIRLWELATGRELRTLVGHADSVYSIVFSADGRILASGSKDHTVKLWEVSTGRELRKLKGHSDLVYSVALSADGKTLATGSKDHTIKLWDITSGSELHTLNRHADSVQAVAFSSDGQTVASGSLDKTVKLWEVATGRELHTLSGHSDSVFAVAFSPDGKTLASAGKDRTIKLWELTTGRELRTLPAGSDSTRSVSFNADGKMLATGNGGNNTIDLWDVANGSRVWTLWGHSHQVYSAAFSPDGKFLISGSLDGSSKVWRLGDRKLLATLIGLDKKDWAVVAPEGQFDASLNAQELMHWTVNNESIDLKQLKERYYEPGLLGKLFGFNKEPLRDVRTLGVVQLFPDVSYHQPGADGKLEIVLNNRGGGIGKVRVLVNGKEIAADARGPRPNPQAALANLTVDLNGASIIPGQPNLVEVIAWNAEGYLSSRGAKIIWTPGVKNEAAAHPDLYAIVVGISDYAGGAFDLTFAAKDAVDMAQALAVGGKGLFGVEKTHITLLNTLGKEGVLQPTKQNIRNAFADVAKQAKPWDVLVIYLSGHGLALTGEEDFYLYPTQEARTLDPETLKDTALRESTTINSTELIEWLTKTEWVKGQKGLAPLKRVMILDTCAAGKAAEKLTRDPKSLSAGQIRAIDRLEDRTGYHVLMGSAADAVSYEASRYGQGLLTYSLLQGMRGPALREDQYVDVSSLFQYAADQVPQLARNIGGIQRPIIAAPQGVSFDVGYLKTKEEKLAIPLAQLKPLLLRPVLVNRDENVGYDDLELVPLLRERLQTESEIKTRGGTESWISVYVNADEMPGAVRPSGTYLVKEEIVRVTMNLVHDGQKIDGFQVEGNKRNKDALVQLILDGISGLMKKHELKFVVSVP